MARLNLATVEKHIENQGKSGDYRKIPFFALNNDKDGAHVKMLMKDASDAYFYHVHRVKLLSKAGKPFYMDVECLNDGSHQCPLCNEAVKYKGTMNPPVGFAKDVLYVPMYVIDRKDNGKVTQVNEFAVWTRGTKFYKDDLEPYAMHVNSLFGGATEIMRSGARGSKETSYRLYASDSDYNGNPIDKDTDLDALKEKAGFTEDMIYGAADSKVKVWTVPQINEFISTGKYPTGNIDKPVQESDKKEDMPFYDSTEDVKPRQRTAPDYGF